MTVRLVVLRVDLFTPGDGLLDVLGWLPGNGLVSVAGLAVGLPG